MNPLVACVVQSMAATSSNRSLVSAAVQAASFGVVGYLFWRSFLQKKSARPGINDKFLSPDRGNSTS
jgi:hypothetical protein